MVVSVLLATRSAVPSTSAQAYVAKNSVVVAEVVREVVGVEVAEDVAVVVVVGLVVAEVEVVAVVDVVGDVVVVGVVLVVAVVEVVGVVVVVALRCQKEEKRGSAAKHPRSLSAFGGAANTLKCVVYTRGCVRTGASHVVVVRACVCVRACVRACTDNA